MRTNWSGWIVLALGLLFTAWMIIGYRTGCGRFGGQMDHLSWIFGAGCNTAAPTPGTPSDLAPQHPD